MPDMDTALKEIMDIDGAVGVALVDHTRGMALGTSGGGKELDLTVAAAGNTDVVRAKLRAMEMLNLNEKIEDILITLDTQYHMIRPLTSLSGKGLVPVRGAAPPPLDPAHGPPPPAGDRGGPRRVAGVADQGGGGGRAPLTAVRAGWTGDFGT